jgi:ElaB/YqjD/DUF883 family membrane-anchored ribosome-binding protein
MPSLKNRDMGESNLYDDVEKIKEALRVASNNVKEKAAEILVDSVEGIQEKTSEIKDNLESYAVKRPFKSLSIAFAAGIFIGFLMRKNK